MIYAICFPPLEAVLHMEEEKGTGPKISENRLLGSNPSHKLPPSEIRTRLGSPRLPALLLNLPLTPIAADSPLLKA